MEADPFIHFKSLVQISFPGLFRMIIPPSQNVPLAHRISNHMLRLAQTLIVCPSQLVYIERGPTVQNNHAAEYKYVRSHALQCLHENEKFNLIWELQTNRPLKYSGYNERG